MIPIRPIVIKRQASAEALAIIDDGFMYKITSKVWRPLSLMMDKSLDNVERIRDSVRKIIDNESYRY